MNKEWLHQEMVVVEVHPLTRQRIAEVQRRLDGRDGCGYKIGQWVRDSSCVAVGYETLKRLRMSVNRVEEDKVYGPPAGLRHATPYELIEYGDVRARLGDSEPSGGERIWCMGERLVYNDPMSGCEITEHAYIVVSPRGTEFGYASPYNFYGIVPGTAILYVEDEVG